MADINTPAPDFNSWMKDAPGQEFNWDDIFKEPEPSAQPQATTPAEPEVAPAPQPPPPPPQEEFFLDAGTSRYKTKEATAQGIADKDRLIEELRTRYKEELGVDPLSAPARKTTSPSEPINYAANSKQYMEDLLAAANSGDVQRYADVQQKFVLDTLSPLAPVIGDFAKHRAVERLSPEIKDIREFMTPDNMTQLKGKVPGLAAAIEAAEGDYRMYEQLPELYRIAYYTSLGLRAPELVSQAQPQAQPQVPPVPAQARPTLQPRTASAPTPNPVRSGFTTSDARKSLIEQLEAQGIKDIKL